MRLDTAPEWCFLSGTCRASSVSSQILSLTLEYPESTCLTGGARSGCGGFTSGPSTSWYRRLQIWALGCDGHTCRFRKSTKPRSCRCSKKRCLDHNRFGQPSQC
ncbi:hypothetical protein ISCGN_013434 [Ixodes scapularis]